MDEMFELISGYLIIEKKLFVRELLSKDSDIKFLINNIDERAISPQIIKEEKTVKIIFDEATDLDLSENYKDFFRNLKIKYGAKFKGRIAVRVTCYATFLSILDFNKEDDRVYIY